MAKLGTDCVDVEVRTHEGAVYIFPDMPFSTLETVLNHSSWQQSGVLILVNVSGALLSLPSRIVHTLSWDGEEKYRGPAVR
jgi:hypothetical protein